VAAVLVCEQGRAANALEDIAASMRVLEAEAKGTRRIAKSAATSLDEAVAYLQKQDGPYEETDSEVSGDKVDEEEVVAEAPGLAHEQEAARDLAAAGSAGSAGDEEDEEMDED
jgi:hypothetical protein